jgi:2-polyprenyl-3-methyl-5-hydroxy-6-metoxy-1,4-benzoquinol methylase
MSLNTKHRSSAPEIMDDFNMEGEILRDALDKIAGINRFLGGNKAILDGIKLLIKNKPKATAIRIIDIGCGNGDMLRAIADYGSKNKLNFILKGIDANDFTINHAKSLSTIYNQIGYECKDVFKNDLEACDIMRCTLTLHHFKDEEILDLLARYKKITTIGIIINDLQRSALAYYLFIALCFVFRLNKMSKEDGLVSILRGFKKGDLFNYAEKLKLTSFTIQWKWAFRYQWIIRTR